MTGIEELGSAIGTVAERAGPSVVGIGERWRGGCGVVIAQAGSVGQWLGRLGLRLTESPLAAYLIGVGLVLVFVYLLGLLVETQLQRRVKALVEALIARIPVVGTIYDLIKKFVALVRPGEAGSEGALKSMSAVWCHFGGPGGSAALALLGSDVPVLVNGQRCLAVLIPTAPVPVGGGLLYVPESWVTRADIGVEAVTSIYVSMGLTSPQHLPRA